MAYDDVDRAAFKPDLTDKQLPATRLRTARLVVSNVADSAPLSETPVFVRSLRVKAEQANVGIVYIGAKVSVDLRVNGYPLASGEELELDVNDLALVYWQGDTLNDGIRIIHSQ